MANRVQGLVDVGALECISRDEHEANAKRARLDAEIQDAIASICAYCSTIHAADYICAPSVGMAPTPPDAVAGGGCGLSQCERLCKCARREYYEKLEFRRQAPNLYMPIVTDMVLPIALPAEIEEDDDPGYDDGDDDVFHESSSMVGLTGGEHLAVIDEKYDRLADAVQNIADAVMGNKQPAPASDASAKGPIRFHSMQTPGTDAVHFKAKGGKHLFPQTPAGTIPRMGPTSVQANSPTDGMSTPALDALT